MNSFKDVLLAHKEQLLTRQNVVGCGLAHKMSGGKTTAEPCVVVLVEKKLPLSVLSVSDVVPPQLEGVPTDVVEVGRLQCLRTRTYSMRPAHPGVSIGHSRVSAGTLGAVVYDVESGTPLVLSNNHVLANGTTGRDGRAQAGDPVFQPGPYDGGTAADQIGTLYKFVPLRLPPPRENLVDAAVALVQAPEVAPDVLGIGAINGTAQVDIGQQVQKSGRSTGVTTGVVQAVHATVQVYLDNDRCARFSDQIVCSRMGDSGDSGSLGVTLDNRAFGLLFAGSDTVTVFNTIQHVLTALGVSFTPPPVRTAAG